MEHEDIGKMDLFAAREYMLQVMTTYKLAKNKRIQLENECQTWKDRVALAREKGKEDLALEAEKQVNLLSEQIERIKLEESEYTEELQSIKEEIAAIKRQPERSVDADLLLAQLQMIVGEPDTLSEEFKKEEIEARLEAMKKIMHTADSEDEEKDI
ncbi:MAG TPA: hypothetical protein PLG43_14755 [Spirochaetia bacterium]|nr:hypothetical protein [Spirochaetia bacterium]